MVINFSNHPYRTWPETQQLQTIQVYGSVLDIEFPHIEPEQTEEELIQLGRKWAQELTCLQPQAVYIVGEHVFTYIMVQLLQRKGIVCMNAKSRRVVQEHPDGTSTRLFQFEGFRQYPVLP